MPVFNFSELSGTHEELMFSPVHAVAHGSLSSKWLRNFIAKEDTEEDTVAGGPVMRNSFIMGMMQSLMKVDIKGTDKENKLVENILDQMVNEFNTLMTMK